MWRRGGTHTCTHSSILGFDTTMKQAVSFVSRELCPPETAAGTRWTGGWVSLKARLKFWRREETPAQLSKLLNLTTPTCKGEYKRIWLQLCDKRLHYSRLCKLFSFQQKTRLQDTKWPNIRTMTCQVLELFGRFVSWGNNSFIANSFDVTPETELMSDTMIRH